MAPLKHVLLVGAGPSIGRTILDALLQDDFFKVTVLRRESSTTTLPPSVNAVTIADSYPDDELVRIFQGQDAVINCIHTFSVREQYRFIDAAIAAGVRRYIPSEFGIDNLNPKARALNVGFDSKGAVQEYLRSREDRIEWTTISCGSWLRWSVVNNYLGLHLREKRFVIWDEGDGYLSYSTEENTALAVARALKEHPEETANQNVFISNFAVTQGQLLAEIERQLGEKLTVERVDSAKLIEEKQAAFKAGDLWAVPALIETGLVTGRYGGHLEKDHKIWNQTLGLPDKSLEEVVRDALQAVHLL